MRMFVNRRRELAFLNQLLVRERPGPGQLILLYGRRRIGKTALLRYWATQTGIAATYWVAERELPTYQRRRFYARLRMRAFRRESPRGKAESKKLKDETMALPVFQLSAFDFCFPSRRDERAASAALAHRRGYLRTHVL